MAAEKTYKIKTKRITGRGSRPDSESIYEGTVEHLAKNVFGYTLEIGASWNNKINRWPKTIKSLVTNLQKSYQEKEASCYDRTSVYLYDPKTDTWN